MLSPETLKFKEVVAKIDDGPKQPAIIVTSKDDDMFQVLFTKEEFSAFVDKGFDALFFSQKRLELEGQ